MSHSLNTANWSSRRQEDSEYLLYQLKILKNTDLIPIAEKKITNIIHFFRGIRKLDLPDMLLWDLPREVVTFCYIKGITDTDIVAEVLLGLYRWFENDEEAQRVFVVFLLFSSTIVYLPIEDDLILDRESINEERWNGSLKRFAHVSYYLKHATVKKLTFSGFRLTDIICKFNDFCCFTKCCESDLLLPLLQYGGRFLKRKDSKKKVNYIFFVFIKRLTNLLTQSPQWDRKGFLLKVPLSELQADLKTTCDSFKLVLTSSPNPYVTSYLIGTDQVSRKQWLPLPNIKEMRLIYDALFPGMGFGYQNPASLKHSCRYVIRERLNENWQLPNGIKKLGLPKAFCNYINLLDE